MGGLDAVGVSPVGSRGVKSTVMVAFAQIGTLYISERAWLLRTKRTSAPGFDKRLWRWVMSRSTAQCLSPCPHLEGSVVVPKAIYQQFKDNYMCKS